MKTSDISNAMPRLQTINECLRTHSPLCPAHSNGKPAVPSTTTHINVRFAPTSPIELEIRQLTKVPTKCEPIDPAPFLMAARSSTTTTGES